MAPNRRGIGVVDCRACSRWSMGVVNVTPDSFSDGGRFADPAAADRPRPMRWPPRVPTGSTSAASPPARAPSRWRAEEELRRVVPVVEALAAAGAARVDRHPQARGGPGGRRRRGHAPQRRRRRRSARSPPSSAWRGSPCTRRASPPRCRTTPATTTWWPRCATSSSPGPTPPRAAGVPEVWIDPGIGFGKTVAHNLALLAHLDELVATGYPVLVGTSRKGFLGGLLGAFRRRRPAPSRSTTVSRARSPPPRGRWRAGPGWCGCTTSVPPSTPRWSSAARSPRQPLSATHAEGARHVAMKGKWAQGIQPRNFAWILKDQLAVCERPGGYGANHRRVRRQEEIIWIREQGFTCVVSLIPSPHNLHNYDELGVTWRHLPFGPHDDPRTIAETLYPELAAHARRRRQGARPPGRARRPRRRASWPATCSGRAWSRLAPQAISVVERLARPPDGPARPRPRRPRRPPSRT